MKIFILSHFADNLKLRDNNLLSGKTNWINTVPTVVGSSGENMMKISTAQGRGQLHRGSSGKTGFNEQENKKASGFCLVKLRRKTEYTAQKYSTVNDCETAL